jgi:DNA-binding beta-propeller fold protein YncE
VLVSQRESPVGEAPPLTPLGTGSAVAVADMKGEPQPAALGPDVQPVHASPLGPTDEPGPWRTRAIDVDVRPLDVAFSAAGTSVFVTGDDSSLREIDVRTGRVLHMTAVPGVGERLRVLHGRYLAVWRKEHSAIISVLDTTAWDREPTLLWVGADPADIVGLPDGRSAVTASARGKRLGWFDLASGRRLGDMRLPHATRQLFLLDIDARPMVGVMGMLYRGEQPDGAWIDLFDPSETPFGATRRSIALGRDLRSGAVTADDRRLLLADRVSNEAILLALGSEQPVQRLAVGQSPIGAFLLGGDRYGITLDGGSRSATVLDLSSMERASTLMLSGVPRDGATSPDGSTLLVTLGGSTWPPTGAGVDVIAGDPPRVITTLETGRGASRVAFSADGRRAAVASYQDRQITLLSR